MMIIELLGKCAHMLDLEQAGTVRLTIHLYGRIRSQVGFFLIEFKQKYKVMPAAIVLLVYRYCVFLESKIKPNSSLNLTL